MSSGKFIFVTGTDTGVGKTVVAQLLISGFVDAGYNVAAAKPVETGCAADGQGGLVPQDGARLCAVASIGQKIEDVVLYRFRDPVAPSVAAISEKRPIDPEHILEYLNSLAERADIVVVEGAGGLLVPITPEYTFADLAQSLNAQVVVVVASKLGALNHALLTFESLRARKLPVLGYVLNQISQAPQRSGDKVTAESSNQATLKGLAQRYGIAELGVVPYLASMDGGGIWGEGEENKWYQRLKETTLEMITSQTTSVH